MACLRPVQGLLSCQAICCVLPYVHANGPNYNPQYCAAAVSSNRLLVTGLPGSGKTFYQFSLMKELASRHATVVVDWASRDRRILFTR